MLTSVFPSCRAGETNGHGRVQAKVGAVRAGGFGHRLPVVRVLQREPRAWRRERERRGPDQQAAAADRKGHVGGAGVVPGRERRAQEARLPGNRRVRRLDGGLGSGAAQSSVGVDPRVAGRRRAATFVPHR